MILSNSIKHVTQITENTSHSPTGLPQKDLKTRKEEGESFFCAPFQSCKSHSGPPKLELPHLDAALQINWSFLGQWIICLLLLMSVVLQTVISLQLHCQGRFQQKYANNKARQGTQSWVIKCTSPVCCEARRQRPCALSHLCAIPADHLWLTGGWSDCFCPEAILL